MKTLEELGFEFIESEMYENSTWFLYIKEDGEYSNRLYLDDKGDVDVRFIENVFITQELHQAIELKMKELGWWK